MDPVVVLWGGGGGDASTWEGTREVDGVLVVHGRTIKQWTKRLDAAVIEPAVVGALWSELDAQVRRRDEAIPDEDRIPRSAWEILGPILTAAGCAILSVAFLALVWQRVASVSGQIATGLVITGVAAALRLGRTLPTVAWGVLVGAGLPTLALLLAVLVEWARPA